jgi:hypothetical protein
MSEPTPTFDPYWTGAGQRLLAQHLLAAAAHEHPGPAAAQWLTTRSAEPVTLLRRAGFPDVAASLQRALDAPAEQRNATYDTALAALVALTSAALPV